MLGQDWNEKEACIKIGDFGFIKVRAPQARSRANIIQSSAAAVASGKGTGKPHPPKCPAAAAAERRDGLQGQDPVRDDGLLRTRGAVAWGQ